jgi:hypothetical protein
VADLEVVLKKGTPVGLHLAVPLAPLQEQTHHSTFVRWTSSVQHLLKFSARENKEHEMADLGVVLKKESVLVLTLTAGVAQNRPAALS